MSDATVTKLPVEERAKPPVAAGTRPLAIVPKDLEEAWRISLAVEKSGIAPKGMDKAEAIMVAIMHGLEIGLPPMAALQKIAVINGRPTLWGDGALGLVYRSGFLEEIDERIEGEGDNRVAICEVKRKGQKLARRTFSVADAQRAGLWDTRETVEKWRDGKKQPVRNDAPWFKYPDRMMQMRARGFALRDRFPDVLGGLYLAEELQGEIVEHDASETPARRPARPTPPKPPVPTPPAIEHKPATDFPVSVVAEALVADVPENDKLRAYAERMQAIEAGPAKPAAPTPPKPPVPGPARKPEPAVFNPEAVLMEWREAAESCRDVDCLDEARDDILGGILAEMFPSDRDEALRIYEENLARLQG